MQPTRGVVVDLTQVGADKLVLPINTLVNTMTIILVNTMTIISQHFHAAHQVARQRSRMTLQNVMMKAGFVRESGPCQGRSAQRFALMHNSSNRIACDAAHIS